jgi:hypothetical protein
MHGFIADGALDLTLVRMRRYGEIQMLSRSFVVIAALLVFAAFASLAFAPAAEAAYISFVAANGNDANPCTVVTAPCKTLARAYSVTPANGTIRILTPLQGNLLITKNVIVEGNGATVVGAIIIDNAAATVTLRGLALNGVKNLANGIRIDAAAAVHIEDCTVERYTNDGIKLVATSATTLFVSDTVSRANNSDGLYVDDNNAQAVIENSRFENNVSSGAYLNVFPGKAIITGSVASGNGQNGIILVSPAAKITETTADDNSQSGIVVRGDNAYTVLDSARTSGNVVAGLQIDGGIAAISNCVFQDSGVAINNQGFLYSYKNNVILKSIGTPIISTSLE